MLSAQMKNPVFPLI